VTGATRALFIFTRAIPEYIWAFLFVAMFGPSAWPAILALMIHNFGVLGRLGADVTENIEPAIPSALRVQGLSRTQIALVAITPMSLGKWLLFFFYRWETCIREATVLGMLGIVSLGFMIRESRARDHYDEMLAFVLMGSVLVLLADILSAIARRYVRTS
jgi:phosphonate transport system permease protein